jgi:predicted naringenin-chalcone synthase
MGEFIASIGTGLPEYQVPQSTIVDFMVDYLSLDESQEKNLRVLYRASGIQYRHSIFPDFLGADAGQFFQKSGKQPSVTDRMKIYKEHATELAKKACVDAFEKCPVVANEITHLITVSCTGMYAPGIDIELVDQLGLKPTTERTSVNFMGCYAAFNALKVARHIVRSTPAAKVLVVCVELCTLHFQPNLEDDILLSNTLFGDGAAAAIVTGEPPLRKSLEIIHTYNNLARAGNDEMGWFINDFGFEMVLTQKVPSIIELHLNHLRSQFQEQFDFQISDQTEFAIHPGGKKILEVVEAQWSLSKERNWASREVLKQYGNMSSPTILFVLNTLMSRLDQEKPVVSMAFGPGLTIESFILQFHPA